MITLENFRDWLGAVIATNLTVTRVKSSGDNRLEVKFEQGERFDIVVIQPIRSVRTGFRK